MNDDQRPFAAPITDARVAGHLPETPWKPWYALAGGFAITCGAFALTLLCVSVVQKSGNREAAAAQEWLAMVAFQVGMTLGALWLAGWFGGNRSKVLALDRWPRPGAMAIIAGTFLLFTLPYTFAVYVLRPDVLIADNLQFVQLLRRPDWAIYAVIIAIGAPVSEELLFRGFMLPALARSRIGFVGATLVTTTLWMALHFTYSIFGLVEIFMIGLILSWALYRTGSLWASLAIHAINNGALAFAMKFQMLPWT